MAAAIFVITACSSAAPSDLLPDVPEQLTFAGSISGQLGRGTSVAAGTTENPVKQGQRDDGELGDQMPAQTQCAEYLPDIGLGPDRRIRYAYVATVTGDLAGRRIGLILRLGGGFEKPQPADVRSGWLEMFIQGEATPRRQIPPITITLDTDRRGGTVDGWLDPGAPDTPTATHVTGHWRCG